MSCTTDHSSSSGIFPSLYKRVRDQANVSSVYYGKTEVQKLSYNNYNFSPLAFYEGFDRNKTREHFAALDQMEMRENDVMLLTYPKCGTHLVREIVHMIQVGKIEYIAEELDFPIEYRNTTEMDSMKSPRTMHSHLWHQMLPKQAREGKQGKVIAIFRNPKDVAVSYWHFSKKIFPTEIPMDEFIDSMIKGQCVSNSWYDWRHSLVEAKRKNRELQMLVLTYEDLIQNLKGGIKTIAAYLGKEVSEDFINKIAEACEISTMRDHKVKSLPKDVQKMFRDGYSPFYRKGKVGEWKLTLTSDVNEALDQWIASQKEDEFTEFPTYKDYYDNAKI